VQSDACWSVSKLNIICRVLSETCEERDLGICVINNVKPIAQCLRAANKAMTVLRMKRSFHSLDIDGFRIIYKGYIRPHIRFCVQAWSPYLAKDKVILENVQRRATKFVHGLRNRSHQQRLDILGLTSLEETDQRRFDINRQSIY